VRDTSGRERVRDASGRELVRDTSAREWARDAGGRESVRDAGGREWVRAAPAREWVRAVESPARPGAVGAVSALAGGEQRATTSVRPDAASEMDLGAPREGSSRRGPAEAANEGLRPGGLGARAEQLAGQLGVRAAGLSIDFIDPAGLSALMSGELAYLQPPAGSEKSATVGARRAAGSSGSSRAISPEEWALVATFPSVATAAQVAGARRAGSWAAGAGSLIRTVQAPAQTLLSASAGGAFGGGSAAGIFGRQLAGSQSMEIGGASMALSGGGPLLSASGGEPARAPLSTVELPRDLVAPTVIATDRARLPSGRAPRGSYPWPRAAQSEIGAGAAPRMVAVGAQAEETGERAMQGAPPWRARPVVLAGGAEAPAGPAGAALALARPFFEIIRGGLSPSEPGSAGQSVGRAALPQPLVSAAPAGEAAARMIQAVRQPPATAPSDDRVTLADLTLISVASASQQVAAAEAGGAPAPAPARPTDSSSSGGAPQSHGPAPAKEDIEELAREVFNELQKLVEIARERSGDPWES
jgi:hypothetical protein